jgi:hypothetical protein
LRRHHCKASARGKLARAVVSASTPTNSRCCCSCCCCNVWRFKVEGLLLLLLLLSFLCMA